MSTGDDLTVEDNPRLRGRRPKNDDLLEPGVWIQHPETKVIHLVTHRYQRDRLLVEGGRLVPEPEREQTPVPTPVESEEAQKIKALEKQIARLMAEREATDVSTTDHGADHLPRTADDRGPSRSKPAVR